MVFLILSFLKITFDKVASLNRFWIFYFVLISTLVSQLILWKKVILLFKYTLISLSLTYKLKQKKLHNFCVSPNQLFFHVISIIVTFYYLAGFNVWVVFDFLQLSLREQMLVNTEKSDGFRRVKLYLLINSTLFFLTIQHILKSRKGSALSKTLGISAKE